MLRKEDRKLAAIILSIGQAVWFVVISIGIIYYSGMLHAMSQLACLHIVLSSAVPSNTVC